MQVGAELRRLVVARAEHLCEYCLIHHDDTFFGCEVDHIIGRQHGGATEQSNLALACLYCNRNKGSNIASIAPGTDRLVRLFDPRRDRWYEHFGLGRDGVTITTQTDVAEATVRILGMNDADRQIERDMLRCAGRYPSQPALQRMLARR